MGSYVTTNSTAIDNRLAVTDNAFGLSSSGSGNNTALNGHILNLSGTGAGSQVNILDGDAISKAFSFADNALSSVLENVLNGQKVNAQSAADSASSLAGAIAEQAKTQAESIAESNKSIIQFLSENMQKIAIGAVVVGLGYYYFKGKR